MKISTKKFEKKLTDFIQSETFVLKSVKPVFKYENGEKTNTIEAIKYGVVNADSFDVLDIKINTTKSIISQEQLDASTDAVFVTFTNAIVKPYKIEFGQAICSVTADAIKFAEN